MTDLDMGLLDLIDAAPAELAKREAFARLDATDWKEETREIVRVIVETAHRLPLFSANDVRPLLPAATSTPRIGRAFALARESGFIEWVRDVRSTDVGTHAKRIGEYRLAGAA